MNDYNFVEKNGNSVLTLSADTEDEAIEYAKEILKNVSMFRIEQA